MIHRIIVGDLFPLTYAIVGLRTIYVTTQLRQNTIHFLNVMIIVFMYHQDQWHN